MHKLDQTASDIFSKVAEQVAQAESIARAEEPLICQKLAPSDLLEVRERRLVSHLYSLLARVELPERRVCRFDPINLSFATNQPPSDEPLQEHHLPDDDGVDLTTFNALPLCCRRRVAYLLAQSTFALPIVDAAVRQFLPQDDSVNKLLGDVSSLPGQQAMARSARVLFIHGSAIMTKG